MTIVVPFQAGGSADLLARIVQQHMEADFDSPFMVENRSGAGGSVGTAYVAKAPPDGYTLLLGTLSGNVLNQFIYGTLPYDPEHDFAPISLLVHLPNLLVVSQKVPAQSVPELITYLKANDGKLNYGSSGIGTSSHLSVMMFELATGTHMTHVPFRSTTDEITSMMNGSVDIAIDSMTTLWPQAQSGLGAGAGSHAPQSALPARRICRPSAKPFTDFRLRVGRACSPRPARRVRSSTSSPPK